jgi:hypothetical protein
MADPPSTSAPASATAGTAVGIEVRHAPVMVAPAQVWLRATGHAGLAAFEESGSVYDGAHHEYYHEWTIRGAPLPAWTKPQNMPAAWNNPNRACGREVAFLLPAAGDYVIDLVVRDRHGNRAVAATGRLTVVAPDSHFPVRSRIYVDPDGDFTGVPAGARTAVTMQDLADRLAAARGAPSWVLLRGGKTHDMGTYAAGTRDNGWMALTKDRRFAMLSSFGGGRARVVPATAGNRIQGHGMFEIWGRPVTDFLTFTGLDFVGGWDPSVERGNQGNAAAIGSLDAKLRNSFVTIHDVDCSGLDKGLHLAASARQGANPDNRMMVTNCFITNWRDYGIFAWNQQCRFAMVGNRITQHVDALHGGPKSDGLVNNHGPVRFQEAAYVYFAQNDVFSRTGWSPIGRKLADQPCLRLVVDPREGQAATVERNVMEGGYHIVNLNDQGPSYPSSPPPHQPIVPFNVVFSDNILIGTAKNLGTAMEVWRSGLTVRNNLFVMPDVALVQAQGAPCLKLGGQKNAVVSPDNASNPIVVHSNTCLNLLGEPNAGGKAWEFLENVDDYFTSLTAENNLVHRPHMARAETAFAPVDVATALEGITPRFRGERYGYRPTDPIIPAGDVPHGGSFAVPYSAILKVLQDQTPVAGGGATDQAYWLAIAATDTRHSLHLRRQRQRLHAELGHFTVSFDATGVTVTNTSGYTWKADAEGFRLSLDRTSLIPAMDTTYASPATIPLPRPLAGSPAIGGATMGRVTPADALQADRADPPSQGALEPAA